MLSISGKIIYLLFFIAVTAIRVVYTKHGGGGKPDPGRKSIIDLVTIAISVLGMAMPFLYIFSGLFNFADYHTPPWSKVLGCLLLCSSAYILWLSHKTLGRYWTPLPALVSNHCLVRTGIYKYIRHPMYAAHIIWGIAQPLVLTNYIVGFSMIVSILPFYLVRVRQEEKLLLMAFGAEYANYMKRTGRLIPKFWTASALYANDMQRHSY